MAHTVHGLHAVDHVGDGGRAHVVVVVVVGWSWLGTVVPAVVVVVVVEGGK